MKKFGVFFTVFCAASLLSAAQNPRFDQGARFEAAGQYEKALGEYRAILSAEPHNANAFYAAGSVRFKMKDYKGAIANYQLAYKYAPKMNEAYEGAAKAYEKLGDKTKAAAERQKNPNAKAAKEETKSTNASAKSAGSDLLAKARAAFDAKDYKTACSAAREVLAKDPGNPGAYYYAGAGRYELGEFDKAEYNLKRSFEYAELGFNAHYYLALIYKKQGKADLEKAELEAYVKFSKNESAVAKARTRIAELSGKSNSEVVKTETPAAPVESAPATEKSLEEVKPVEAKAEPAPQPVEVKNPPAPKKPMSPMEQANEAYRQGDYASALSQYQELQKKFRDENTRAYLLFQIGNVYRSRRDFRSAVSKFRELVELYPSSEWSVEAQRAWEDAVWQEKNAKELRSAR
ncbi:MAG: tetratricopeptide repeat protein [Hallerella porci]|uniref:TolA-binding protein n=1 Tax=Hallerella porci TaxID=1945871 RepID=A0ABX5LQR2_9BACT|nr:MULTISPECIES: tetratricopeptide repeat protein [Hallerella]MCI5600421.1 tetratricopeptide repeat protein [Hallerella sp.]MDY3922638.1 tetratricopeptide repeat protein [Hallerella porci]PWL04307.1 TolA-binding protein [Hallerella porci]